MEEAPFLELLNDAGRREEAAREQDRRREKFSHVLNRTPGEAAFLFGLAVERQVLHQLETADASPAANLCNRLAEAYALQGRFREAWEVATPEERDAKEYAEKERAVKSPGTGCMCPPMIVKPSKQDAKGTREPSRHEIERVFDGERTYALFRCRLCHGLSARQMEF